jgi:hypothetical protein
MGQNLERKLQALGLPKGFRVLVEDVSGWYKVEIYAPGKEPGDTPAAYFRAAEVSLRSAEWANEKKCHAAFDHALEQDSRISGVWVVRGAELFDPKLRSKGIGRAIYQELLDKASKSASVLGPHSCVLGGSTSAAAKRAWKSLPGSVSGPFKWSPSLLPTRAKTNPSRSARKNPVGQTAKQIASNIDTRLKKVFPALAVSAAATTLLGEDSVIVDLAEAPAEATELEKLNAAVHVRLRVHGKGWKKGAPAPAALHVETLRHTPIKSGGVKMRKGKTTPDKAADKVIAWFKKNEYRLKGKGAKSNPRVKKPKKMKVSRNEVGERVFTLPSGKQYNVLKVDAGGSKGNWRISEADESGNSREWILDFGTLRDCKDWLDGEAKGVKSNPLGTLPAAGKATWERVYSENLMGNHDEGYSARVAWSVVKKAYEKKGGRWVKRNPTARRVKTAVAALAMSAALASGAEDTRGLSRVKHDRDRATSSVKGARNNPGSKMTNGIKIEAVRAKIGPNYQLSIDGKIGGKKIRGYTEPVYIGKTTITRRVADRATFAGYLDGTNLPYRERNKVVDAVLARLLGLEALETLTVDPNPAKWEGGLPQREFYLLRDVMLGSGSYFPKNDKDRWALERMTRKGFLTMHESRGKDGFRATKKGRKVAEDLVKQIRGLRKRIKARPPRPWSRRAGSNPSLGWKDKEVILDFFERNKATSSFLSTDGSTLKLSGGTKVAVWKGSKIEVKGTGKGAIIVEKAIRKMASPSMLTTVGTKETRPNPSGSTWVKGQDRDGRDAWVYGKDVATKKFPFAEVALVPLEGAQAGKYGIDVRDALYSDVVHLAWAAKPAKSLDKAKKIAEKWISKNRLKSKPKWSLMAARANPVSNKPKKIPFGERRNAGFKKKGYKSWYSFPSAVLTTGKLFDAKRDKIVAKLGKSSLSSEASKVEVQDRKMAPSRMTPHSWYDIGSANNQYFLKWDDGLKALFYFDMGMDQPTTLDGVWTVRSDTPANAKRARERISKVLGIRVSKTKPTRKRKGTGRKSKPSRDEVREYGRKETKKAIKALPKVKVGDLIRIHTVGGGRALTGQVTKASSGYLALNKPNGDIYTIYRRPHGAISVDILPPEGDAQSYLVKKIEKAALVKAKGNPSTRRKHSQLPLEGPFTFPNGRTVYYDRGEGEYYDQSTDIYLSADEAWDLHTRPGKANPKKSKATATKKKKSAAKKKKATSKKKKGAVKRKK